MLVKKPHILHNLSSVLTEDPVVALHSIFYLFKKVTMSVIFICVLNDNIRQSVLEFCADIGNTKL